MQPICSDDCLERRDFPLLKYSLASALLEAAHEHAADAGRHLNNPSIVQNLLRAAVGKLGVQLESTADCAQVTDRLVRWLAGFGFDDSTAFLSQATDTDEHRRRLDY